jgi:fused signal recognition particle receptor
MALFGKFFSKFSKKKASDDDLDEFRRVLIEADLGEGLTEEVLEMVRRESSENLEAAVKSYLTQQLSSSSRSLNRSDDSLNVILVVGVNGTGKTTSSAKLAHYLQNSGSSVMLAAADTFRAAAVEQLETWGKRIGVSVVTGRAGADPASLCFDAAMRAKNEAIDFLIIDTAGRLHNKTNLMEELGKVKRVIEKISPVSEILFVLDATTGQNAILQARAFMEATELTGLVLTKLDGSSKGGIALAIEKVLGVPIKFIGTGEEISDWDPFDPERYLRELLT